MPYADPEKQQECVTNHLRETRARHRAEWFAGKVCAYCSSTDRLELDHIDPALKDPLLVKHGNGQVWSWRKDRREAELAKCQALCYSCHRLKSSGESRIRPSGTIGSSNGRAILTDDLVRSLRLEVSAGMSRISASEKYGVTPEMIGRIVRRQSWKHVL